MFSALHAKACTILGLSIPVVFAAQSAGGALGNMICTNNVVAACTTVGLKNSEGIVMRKVFKPICILWTLYAVLALIYVDRKSTRLNSSHANISYAVFCLKKKKKRYVIHI